MDGIIVFCNVDENGDIIEAFTGRNIIQSKQYDFNFYTTDEGTLGDLSNYKVDLETRQLIKK